ncbi:MULTISPECIES: hypothetical protein [Chromohalobacter]|uniref:hypothetical protein n=1 Tax=Chromohalobacter TaxID=42054 RepID=UPI001FFD3317|nr:MULTISPECIES: hypothetical protein [Chromohalobacter]MCK2045599.1 hypothetical protein [Chromohalobacter moromii]MCT8468328.1 hypothetical protein [Chromohalobacter canadensis]MCT8471383.1 hypothetical protein [Chromohalobacter canadensis]MCT8498836.1 hypothetical protein [Chromohalobacter canadensis]
MLIAGRVVAFTAVLAALLWLVRPEGGFEYTVHWDKLITFLLALSAFLGTEGYAGTLAKRKGWNVHPNDQALLRRLFRELDPDGVVQFLREHDFGGTFMRSSTAPVLRFADTWVGADKEFQDNEVEVKHKELVEAAKKLSGLIASKTSPISGDASSVVSKRFQGKERPEWILRDAHEINEAADLFVEKFDEFVKTARRKIPVDGTDA